MAEELQSFRWTPKGQMRALVVGKSAEYSVLILILVTKELNLKAPWLEQRKVKVFYLEEDFALLFSPLPFSFDSLVIRKPSIWHKMGASLAKLLEVFWTKKLDIVVIGLENRYVFSLAMHSK